MATKVKMWVDKQEQATQARSRAASALMAAQRANAEAIIDYLQGMATPIIAALPEGNRSDVQFLLNAVFDLAQDVGRNGPSQNGNHFGLEELTRFFHHVYKGWLRSKHDAEI